MNWLDTPGDARYWCENCFKCHTGDCATALGQTRCALCGHRVKVDADGHCVACVEVLEANRMDDGGLR